MSKSCPSELIPIVRINDGKEARSPPFKRNNEVLVRTPVNFKAVLSWETDRFYLDKHSSSKISIITSTYKDRSDYRLH